MVKIYKCPAVILRSLERMVGCKCLTLVSGSLDQKARAMIGAVSDLPRLSAWRLFPWPKCLPGTYSVRLIPVVRRCSATQEAWSGERGISGGLE
jgi:hypothetical protein